jgi:hypothetical protein
VIENDILKLVLDISGGGTTNQTVARIRYREPSEKTETSDDLADSCLQTSLRVLDYTVENLSHLDFYHPMSSAMEVESVNQIEVIAHAHSQIVFKLDIFDSPLGGRGLQQPFQKCTLCDCNSL